MNHVPDTHAGAGLPSAHVARPGLCASPEPGADNTSGMRGLKRCFVALIGGTVLLVGIAFLVLPGPGSPIVAAGLAILATEFFWAKRALRKAKGAMAKVRRKSGLRAWLARFRPRQVPQHCAEPFAEMSEKRRLHDMPSSTLALNTPTTPKYLALAGWLAATFSAAAVGGLFMPDAWYAALNKPAWNPPGWLFGPVWTTLYILIAVAAWLVWQQGGWSSQRKPLVLFFAQLALNAAWTPLFFGLHRPDLAFFEIAGLWLMILALMASFWRVRRLASALLVPYLAWVSFAAFLNFTIWRLNP